VNNAAIYLLHRAHSALPDTSGEPRLTTHTLTEQRELSLVVGLDIPGFLQYFQWPFRDLLMLWTDVFQKVAVGGDDALR
jgi:hypothetical protein